MKFRPNLYVLPVVCAIAWEANAATSYVQVSPEQAMYSMTDEYLKVIENSIFNYQSIATTEFLSSYDELQKAIEKVQDEGDIGLEADIFLNSQDVADISNFSFKTVEQEGDSASVLMTTKFDDLNTYNCFQLKQVNGEWKLNDISNIFPDNEKDAIKQCPLTSSKPLKALIDSFSE